MGNTYGASRYKRTITYCKYAKDDIDWLIPHSANLRMIESICEKSQIPIQKH